MQARSAVAVVGNVDPQMPPERFWCPCARELDEKRLYRFKWNLGAEIWRDFARNSAPSPEHKNPSISMTYGGCAGSLQRTALRASNSLITGKIEGISSVLGPSCVTRPLPNNRLAAKFPNGQNRESSLENREPY
jgi:hypothetical protein